MNLSDFPPFGFRFIFFLRAARNTPFRIKLTLGGLPTRYYLSLNYPLQKRLFAWFIHLHFKLIIIIQVLPQVAKSKPRLNLQSLD
jgi:hypothetical protein